MSQPRRQSVSPQISASPAGYQPIFWHQLEWPRSVRSLATSLKLHLISGIEHLLLGTRCLHSGNKYVQRTDLGKRDVTGARWT